MTHNINQPRPTFEFMSGPDKMTARLATYGVSISGEGPRGGYCPGVCFYWEQLNGFLAFLAAHPDYLREDVRAKLAQLASRTNDAADFIDPQLADEGPDIRYYMEEAFEAATGKPVSWLMTNEAREELAEALGYEVGDLPVEALGLPIIECHYAIIGHPAAGWKLEQVAQ